MEFNKCLGCMEDFRGYPCPNCGYDPGADKGNGYALPPETILYGKYLVGRVLGQGGFGITYVGWDLALERKVAIKEYYPSGQVSRVPGERTLTWYTNANAQQAKQSGMEMFLKEARKMARVDEIPGVVRVRDLFRENDTAYIVMDFVEGETLKAQLKRTGPLSWDRAKEVFLPAIRIMEQVHQAGLVHRDLSPDNLMLTPKGTVKILDLGAAKDLSINTGASSMQVAKDGFSPLEQYTKKGGSGPWTDVYAMAATIYYALTGILPPNAVDRMEEDTLSFDYPAFASLPEQAIKALKNALALTAQKRTQSMAELEEGLFGEGKVEPEAKQKPKPEPKPEPRPEPKPEPKSGKRKNWIQAAVIAVIAVCVAVGVYTKQAETAPKVQQPATFAAGNAHTVALRSDGTVVAVGWNELGQCDVGSWRNEDIVSVAAGVYHTVGLRSDGTVTAVGGNGYGQCDVGSWRDIVAVTAGYCHTVGLQSDGTVVATGWNEYGQCDVSSWRNIVAVAAGKYHTVGLQSDGKVVAVGRNEHGQCNVSSWRKIVAISGGIYHTVGLRSDGTVVAVGLNDDGQCDVSNWRDIVAISGGIYHTVGLRCDGSVVATGAYGFGQCGVSSWRDIVSVAAGDYHTVGLRSDGTVVAVGRNADGQCDVGRWTNIATL